MFPRKPTPIIKNLAITIIDRPIITAIIHTATLIPILRILTPTLIPLILTDLLTITIAIPIAKLGAMFPDTTFIIAAANTTNQDIGNIITINPKRRLNASFFLFFIATSTTP